MTARKQLMETLLKRKLQAEVVSVEDESHLHAGHREASASGESHFKVMVVSLLFKHKTLLERHRMVNSALKPLFEEGLHALKIKAVSPEEHHGIGGSF
ncbi:MAG: BolA family transcriptional regulator [Candidatus Margulisbacteria bacterium]|nr:BolA family transcriptional regulator [Candidatus Margulisiibacteriota bacterium]